MPTPVTLEDLQNLHIPYNDIVFLISSKINGLEIKLDNLEKNLEKKLENNKLLAAEVVSIKTHISDALAYAVNAINTNTNRSNFEHNNKNPIPGSGGTTDTPVIVNPDDGGDDGDDGDDGDITDPDGNVD